MPHCGDSAASCFFCGKFSRIYGLLHRFYALCFCRLNLTCEIQKKRSYSLINSNKVLQRFVKNKQSWANISCLPEGVITNSIIYVLPGVLVNTLFRFENQVCQGEKLQLRCPYGTTIIILWAKYGRQVPSYQMCGSFTDMWDGAPIQNLAHSLPTEDTNCLATTSLQVCGDPLTSTPSQHHLVHGWRVHCRIDWWRCECMYICEQNIWIRLVLLSNHMIISRDWPANGHSCALWARRLEIEHRIWSQET